MESVASGGRRSAGFERAFCPAVFALAMTQDAVDDAEVGNKGDGARAGAAGAASQRAGLEYFPDRTSPRAAGLPGQWACRAPFVGQEHTFIEGG